MIINIIIDEKNGRSCHIKTNYNREYWEEYFLNV